MDSVAEHLPKDRIKAARLRANLSRQELARLTRLAPSTIAALENGQNQLRPATAELLAPALKVTVHWLVTGNGHETAPSIPVVGYMGDGSAVYGLEEADLATADLERIPTPLGAPANAVALMVRGESGYPLLRDGMALVYWARFSDPSLVVGEDCVVRTVDGRTLVRIVEQGTAPDTWNLISINGTGAPLRNVRLVWAAPIEVMIRRRQGAAAPPQVAAT